MSEIKPNRPNIDWHLELMQDTSFMRGYHQQRFTTNNDCPGEISSPPLWQEGFNFGRLITQLENDCNQHWPRIGE